MIRVLLAAGDEQNLFALKNGMDWDIRDMIITGQTTDGENLMQLIEYRMPDLVITDAVLPGKNGTDVMRECVSAGYPVLFLLIAEETDICFMKDAVRYKAADILLRPFTEEQLDLTLQQVPELIRNQRILSMFREISPYRTSKFFNLTDQPLEQESADPEIRLLEDSRIDYDENFAVGLCFGIFPEIMEQRNRENYQELVLTLFSMYSRISQEFSRKGIGFEVRKTAHMLHMIGVFPKSQEADYIDFYLKHMIKQLEAEYHVGICLGAGLHAADSSMLYNSYRTARYAFELYFFTPEPVIEFRNVKKQFDHPMSDYEKHLDDAFHAILIKSPDALEKIDRAVNLIGSIHFGNWQASLMRVMNFTGELTSRFQRYKLFQGNFYEMQNDLQTKVLGSLTFPEAKQRVHEYYEQILPTIYRNNKTSTKVIVEQVKSYIRENFMNELSIKELSEVACVSPNYFSHMFKNEVGQNYKDFLTGIRMEHALDLILNSDYKLYEISEAVGYNNMRTFVDAFKQIYHDSPTKYKKKLLEEQKKDT